LALLSWTTNQASKKTLDGQSPVTTLVYGHFCQKARAGAGAMHPLSPSVAFHKDGVHPWKTTSRAEQSTHETRVSSFFFFFFPSFRSVDVAGSFVRRTNETRAPRRRQALKMDGSGPLPARMQSFATRVRLPRHVVLFSLLFEQEIIKKSELEKKKNIPCPGRLGIFHDCAAGVGILQLVVRVC
jgi:hypothetical protein